MRRVLIRGLVLLAGVTALWSPVTLAQPKAKPNDLKKLVESLIRSAKGGQVEPFKELAIPDPEAWFTRMFGPESGALLARSYSSEAPNFANVLFKRFAALASKKGLRVHAGNSESLSRMELTRSFAFLPVVATAQAPEDIFGLWVESKDEKGMELLGYWCFVDGRFRFVGWLYATYRPGQTTHELLWVGPVAEVEDVRVIKVVRPKYSEMARRTRTQGEVRILGVVAVDGVFRNGRVLQGHPLLIEAVMEAMQNQRFAPLTINGTPVEVFIVIQTFFEIFE
jgi:hypothetical protein